MNIETSRREEILQAAETVLQFGPYDIAILKHGFKDFSATVWHCWTGKLQAAQGNFTTLEAARTWAEQQVVPGSNIDYVNKVLDGKEFPITSVTIMLPIPPVSYQKSRARKDEVISLIRSITKNAKFLLTGDVAVSITWHLHEKDIYESDAPPDVDNIIKPILDALCGSEGILIDDCQVQYIGCSRIDWDRPSQQIQIEVEFFDDLGLRHKEGTVFVRFKEGLCFLIHRKDSAADNLLRLKLVEYMLKKYHEIRELEGNYYAGIEVSPAQRIFHISRVADKFPVIELEALENELRSQLPKDELGALEAKIKILRRQN